LTTTPAARRALVVLALLGGLLLAANCWRYASYTDDDCYISLRYAQNLVSGHGLVFNPGERVEGYTNLLYVLLSAALLKVGIDPIAGLKIAGAAFSLATLALVLALERKTRPAEIALFPGLSLLLLAPLEAFVYWTFCPLETSLYTLLLVGAVLALLARRDLAAVLLFFLLTLTRPEGPFHFALAAAGAFLLDARCDGPRRAFVRHGRNAGALFVLLLPVFLARHAYYGEWLPNTYYAKVTGGHGALLSGLGYLRDTALAFPLVILAALAVLFRGLRERGSVLALLVLAQLAYSAAVGGDALPFFRFFLPVLPFGCVLVALEIEKLAQGAGRLRPALAPAAVAVHLAASLLTGQPYRAFGADRDGVAGARAGEWLKTRFPPGTWVAVNPAGSLPYFSGLPAIDMLGLNDAAIARRPVFQDSSDWIWAGHRRGWGAYVLSRRPTVILFSGGAGSHHPYYLGDYELADDYRFRFFYRPNRTRLPAVHEGRRLARFFGFPYGDSPAGMIDFLDVGIVARFSHGVVPSTLVTEGDLAVCTFERDDRDAALFEPARDPAGPGPLLSRAVAAWTRDLYARPPVDPNARAEGEALCEDAPRRIQAGDVGGAKELLTSAASANASTPRVFQYLANVAVLEGDLFAAAAAEKEALRLEPGNAVFRSNLEHLLTVPYNTWRDRATKGPKRP